MKNGAVLKKNPNMVSRQMEDEMILVPVLKTSDDINCIYTFNKDASIVWNMIDGKKAVAQIKKAVLKEFDVNSKEAEKRLRGFFKDLKAIKAIK